LRALEAQTAAKDQLRIKTIFGYTFRIATNRRNAMLRPLLALSAAALVATSAAAATYSASPVTPASGKFAARDLLWVCAGGTCSGSTLNSRPLVLCQGLAKQVGRLQSFSVDGRPLSDPELERCNASARTGKDQALANAR
jgi:hypothetical protein